MDIRKVKKLIELLEESGISELEISEGEESVRISRHPRVAMQALPCSPSNTLRMYSRTWLVKLVPEPAQRSPSTR